MQFLGNLDKAIAPDPGRKKAAIRQRFELFSGYAPQNDAKGIQRRHFGVKARIISITPIYRMQYAKALFQIGFLDILPVELGPGAVV